MKRLPGQPGQYLNIARLISGPVLGAGGDRETVRRLTENTGVVSQMVGQPMEFAGREVMEILQGRARAQNPMYAALVAGGAIPHADVLNRMDPAKRLETLAEAMQKVGANSELLKDLTHTYSTQLGTLAYNLFGIDSILGRLGASPFEALLRGLERFNAFLDSTKESWTRSILELGKILSYNFGPVVHLVV